VLRQSGRYIGIDINNRTIEWCSENITKRHPNFRFFHYDVAEQLYNPAGTLPISSCKIPAAAGSVDLIIVQSVFTHMFEEGVCFYLEEFARVLKPSGNAYATFFVVDDDIRAAIRDAPVTVFNLSFRYRHGAGCFVNDTRYPTFAVAYTPEKLEQMAKSSGLTSARALIRGYWSGSYPEADCGQDVMILRRSMVEP
jgi:SAM-dependent methyltransferase